MYAPTTWVTGDTITATKINNAETQAQEAMDETTAVPTFASGVLTCNMAASRVFRHSLTAAITSFTISNIPAATRRCYFDLKLTYDGTLRAVTWTFNGVAVKWDGGTAPSLGSASGKIGWFAFWSDNAGAAGSWYGTVMGVNF